MADKEFDKRDRLLIAALEENSRLSYRELGQKAGMSGAATEERIQKWLTNGFIIRLFAEPDPFILGYRTARLYLKMEGFPSDVERAFELEYSAKPTVQWFAITQGKWNYIIRFIYHTETEFNHYVMELLSHYGKYVKEKDIVITHYQGQLPITYFTQVQRYDITTEKPTEKKEIDDIDRKILQQLFENARAPTTQLAQEVGLSPDAIQYRIKQLTKKGIIRRYTGWLDRRKLGYDYYKIFIWFHFITPEDEVSFLNYCTTHPNTVYINRVIGHWDLEVDVDVKGLEELDGVLKKMQNKFSRIIRDYSFVAILRDYMPNPFASEAHGLKK